MHLCVLIPAFNEEKTIGEVLKKIPKRIRGIKKLTKVVVDDGSIDQTAVVAKKNGADFVIKNGQNLGLAKTFIKGIRFALTKKADLIVNLDADLQHNPAFVPNLVAALIKDKADLVVGNRQIEKLTNMRWGNKYGNLLGTFLIRILTGCKIKDMSCGFRAYSRRLASRFYLYSDHTYTHETIMFAYYNNYKILEVPIDYQARKHGQSRLIKSMAAHISKSLKTIFLVLFLYKGVKSILFVGLGLNLFGLILFLRFLYLHFVFGQSGHLQSLLLGSLSVGIGLVVIMLGIIVLLLRINRRILEEVSIRTQT